MTSFRSPSQAASKSFVVAQMSVEMVELLAIKLEAKNKSDRRAGFKGIIREKHSFKGFYSSKLVYPK
ncbi:MAG: hypothetical protein UW09_C0004G0102 [candidate division TM6 bacterium GW2011_GWF2_43_87]|nr:MAG: hypothetical protein UW09_C0004G0102 [candidate division TM6 bacterium GW2011_GWF2_43_87]